MPTSPTTTTTEISETPPDAVVVHEPHGFVRLTSYMASDLMVVNAARVSFRKESGWRWNTGDGQGFPTFDEAEDHVVSCDEPALDIWPTLSEADQGLVRFLLKNKHGTPFEQNFFQFHIRAPIFVFREWHRHRIGISINEESGRYVQLKNDFYVPDRDHLRTQQGKPGHYTYEREPDDAKAAQTQRHMAEMYARCYEAYEVFLRRGVAKEIARSVLPVGIYSQMYWSVNARSLMNFLQLRNSPKALQEIRDYAAAMEKLFAQKMPVTWHAFHENGRVAP